MYAICKCLEVLMVFIVGLTLLHYSYTIKRYDQALYCCSISSWYRSINVEELLFRWVEL